MLGRKERHTVHQERTRAATGIEPTKAEAKGEIQSESAIISAAARQWDRAICVETNPDSLSCN